MTEAEVIKWILMSIIGLAMWFLKRNIEETDNKIKELDFDLQKIKRDYLHRDDFREFKIELRLMFEDLKSDIKDLKQDD